MKIVRAFSGLQQGMFFIPLIRKESALNDFLSNQKGPEIHDIHEDRFGTLWVGGFELFKIERYINPFINHSNLSQHSSSGLLTIFKDRAGRIWQAEEDVVIRHSSSNNDEMRIELNAVYGIYEDRQGDIWLSRTCTGVLNRLSGPDLSSLETYYVDRSALEENMVFGCVNRVMEDRDGNMWVPVYLGGLSFFDRKTKTFKQYTSESHGLGSNAILRLNEAHSEQGVLWLSTEEGLSRFDIQNETFTNYHSELLTRAMMTLEDKKDAFGLPLLEMGCTCLIGRQEKLNDLIR